MFRIIVCLLSLTFGSAYAAVSEWLSFEIKNNSIQFPITIGGVEGQAVIDPTAKVNMLSTTFAQAHQDQIKRTSYMTFRDIKGERNLPVFKKVDVKLFGSELSFNDLLADDGQRADLTLGIPFFRQYIIQIDFPRNRLRLIDHKGYNIKKIANVEMKTQVDPNLSSSFNADNLKSNDQTSRVVKVGLNGKDYWLTFDLLSGPGVITSRETAKEFSGLTTPFAGEHNDFNLAAPADLFQLQSVKLGPYELEGVLLAVEPENGKRLMPMYRRSTKTGTNIEKRIIPDGVLGLDVLQHLVVTFDYSNDLMGVYAE